MGPIPSREYCFVVVDYCSCFIEVNMMKDTQSHKIVVALDKLFSRHGLSELIRADNGPQLISGEFGNYLEENDIEHRRTTPLGHRQMAKWRGKTDIC